MPSSITKIFLNRFQEEIAMLRKIYEQHMQNTKSQMEALYKKKVKLISSKCRVWTEKNATIVKSSTFFAHVIFSSISAVLKESHISLRLWSMR